jgi:TolA-binding protein
VISDYPQSTSVPQAYYKLGQTYERLNQVDLARKAYDTVIKTYPDDSATQLARQALERLNRR